MAFDPINELPVWIEKSLGLTVTATRVTWAWHALTQLNRHTVLQNYFLVHAIFSPYNTHLHNQPSDAKLERGRCILKLSMDFIWNYYFIEGTTRGWAAAQGWVSEDRVYLTTAKLILNSHLNIDVQTLPIFFNASSKYKISTITHLHHRQSDR